MRVLRESQPFVVPEPAEVPKNLGVIRMYIERLWHSVGVKHREGTGGIEPHVLQ